MRTNVLVLVIVLSWTNPLAFAAESNEPSCPDQGIYVGNPAIRGDHADGCVTASVQEPARRASHAAARNSSWHRSQVLSSFFTRLEAVMDVLDGTL